MSSDEHTFPKDWGTGLQETVDWADAASFANLADHPNTRGYVAHGYEFDYDAPNDILRIDPGKAFVWREEVMTNDHSGDGGPDEKLLAGAIFTAQRGASGDINLVANDINFVYVRADRTDNDTVVFSTNTTGEQPTTPSLLIGRVDTAAEAVYLDNRSPTTTHQRIVVTGDTHGAEY